ncbi:MAG: protein kinase [Muribaculaceae bacterium]|nr:protein kinase [Muribaculaceae bacterium]
MHLNANTELQNGKFRIIRVLGQGGFGITYLAENVFFDRLVAIKEFFPKDFCGRDDTSHLTLGTQNNAETVNKLKARFLKEAKNIAKLDHPGIVKIHDIFEENNTAYYVMDYIDGENLNEMVKRNGPLPEAKAVEYICKVGDALEYIHSRNMTHFDVKPANIVVRRSDDLPILIDFGLSKQYDRYGDATSTLMQGVSQGYSPIEMYNAGSVSTFSPQTDLYSLGATLYYLLTGNVPQPVTELVEAELVIPDNVPSRSKHAINQAMKLSKSQRTQSAETFVAQLKSDYTTQRPTASSEDTVLVEDVEPMNSQPDVYSNRDEVSNIKSQENENIPEHTGNHSNSSKTAKVLPWIIIGVLVVFGFIIWQVNSNNEESQYAIYSYENDSVADLGWDSPLGFAVYSGEVMRDTLSDGTIKKIPNGIGKAVFKNGKFEGATYEGEFKSGVLDGHTIYTLPNGDTFEGTFHDNHYENGKYTDRASGEYFEGSFKNSQPYKGKWFSANGVIIESIGE